jgi:hypothetical protein
MLSLSKHLGSGKERFFSRNFGIRMTCFKKFAKGQLQKNHSSEPVNFNLSLIAAANNGIMIS